MKSAANLMIVLLALALASVSSFTSTPRARPVLTPGKLIQGGRNLHNFVLYVEEKASEASGQSKKVSADGTYYDDEIEPAPKIGISNSMKERLAREASTGLDPDQKQTNVLLYIIGAVAVLVVLGGSGILY